MTQNKLVLIEQLNMQLRAIIMQAVGLYTVGL